MLYDQAFNDSFHAVMESIQYNTCLAITGAIRGMSKEKIYQELDLEPLQLQKTLSFIKNFKNEHPKYLLNLIPVGITGITSAIIEWNNLGMKL